MNNETYLTNVYDKLKQDGFELRVNKINNLDVFIAINKKFKLSWLATQMNIFVIAGFTNRISKDIIEIFSKDSLKYAIKNNQGLPRGLQSGVVSFSVLASQSIDDIAKQWIKKRPEKHFASFEFPVLFDLTNNQVIYYDKTPIWGAVYYKFFRNFSEKYFKGLDKTCPYCKRIILFNVKYCPFCGKEFNKNQELSKTIILPKTYETNNPIEILKIRYINGEITKEQFEKMKKDLEE